MTQIKPRVPRPPAKAPAASTRAAKPKAAPQGSKLDRVIAALRTAKGASVHDLMQLTGWQMHSVRGALAGAIKKKRGLPVESQVVQGVRRYRIGAAG